MANTVEDKINELSQSERKTYTKLKLLISANNVKDKHSLDGIRDSYITRKSLKIRVVVAMIPFFFVASLIALAMGFGLVTVAAYAVTGGIGAMVYFYQKSSLTVVDKVFAIAEEELESRQ